MKIAQHPFPDDRKTGYKFLSRVYKRGVLQVYHPGHDYNSGPTGYSDLGMPVFPYADGVVIYARSTGSGWGNLLVVHHPHLVIWSRYAHFHKIFVKEGEKVFMNTTLGLCGQTGTSAPHVHAEIIKKKIPSWTWYPNGWTKEQVMEYFVDPFEYVESINKKWDMLDGIPEWAHNAWHKAKKAGFNLDPHDEIDLNKFQKILKQTGTINEVGPIPTYRFMVILEKMGIL